MATRLANLRWRLRYADGSIVDEDRDSELLASMKNAPKGAIEMLLCDAADGLRPIVSIGLTGDDQGRTMPFFYRRRSRILDGSGRTWDSALVCGRAHPSSAEASVWVWDAMLCQLVDCPEELIEPNTIEGFLS